MIKSYVINLDKDVDRLQFFSENFSSLGLSFERISAVNGKEFPEADYQQFMKLRPRNNKTWLRGQMGCFLSHFKAWELIANGSENFCTVFEDDIHISPDLKHILDDTSWIPDNADIIRLETSTNRVRLGTKPVAVKHGRAAYKVMSTSWNAGGYILSRSAAKKLVAIPPVEHQPSDILLFNFAESSLANQFHILQFYPALCTQDKHHSTGLNLFASNIESSDTQLSRIFSILKYCTPKHTFLSLQKSSQGYKRIHFQ